MAAIGKVLQSARSDILIVDPYMDEKALTVYGVLAAEKIELRLLADATQRKPSLAPTVAAWKAQHGATRPLDARLAPARQLHDRLILVDNSEAWTLTQSLNAFADRSPASIVKADAETSKLKVAAYSDLWSRATPI
jgi:hypothetical protein